MTREASALSGSPIVQGEGQSDENFSSAVVGVTVPQSRLRLRSQQHLRTVVNRDIHSFDHLGEQAVNASELSRRRKSCKGPISAGKLQQRQAKKMMNKWNNFIKKQETMSHELQYNIKDAKKSNIQE